VPAVQDLLFGRAVKALERIAEALEQATAPQPAQPAAGSCPQCGAPEEKQVNASTLGGPPRKQCVMCHAEYLG
jgi:hypothetical protein